MNKNKFFILLLLSGMILLVFASSVFAAQAAVIDFEGLSAGQIVTSLSSGAGISGPNFGTVGVAGQSNNFGGQAAMTFNSNCLNASCSGQDDDLDLNIGMVLILTEDGDTSDPDDAAGGGTLSFDFSGFGVGYVTINSLDLLDIEENGGTVQVTLTDTTVLSFPIPNTGNNSLQTLAINVENIVSMRVNLAGSGAVDNVRMMVEEEEEPPTGGTQGCTPGYWRQEQHYGAWVGVTPTTIYSDVFGVGPAIPLGDAVQTNGGGLNALLRHSTAALLNTLNPNVAYPYTSSQVIQMTQDAFNSGDYEPTKDDFDAKNNLGCPLGRDGVPNSSSTNSISLPTFYDGRINNYDDAAPVVPFGYDSPSGRGLVLYSANRETLLIVSPEEIAAVPEFPEENTLIAANEERGIFFYRLTTGEFQINAATAEGKTYTMIFNFLYTNSGYSSFEEWVGLP